MVFVYGIKQTRRIVSQSKELPKTVIFQQKIGVNCYVLSTIWVISSKIKGPETAGILWVWIRLPSKYGLLC